MTTTQQQSDPLADNRTRVTMNLYVSAEFARWFKNYQKMLIGPSGKQRGNGKGQIIEDDYRELSELRARLGVKPRPERQTTFGPCRKYPKRQAR